MSKIYFSDEQVELLSKNKYVANVTNKGITYTLEFKELFLSKIKSSNRVDIFEEAGLPLKILGKKRIKECAYRWIKQSNAGKSLEDTRKYNPGRSSFKEQSLEQQLQKSLVQIETLKQEIDFLRQIQRLEGRYQPTKSPSMKNIK